VGRADPADARWIGVTARSAKGQHNAGDPSFAYARVLSWPIIDDEPRGETAGERRISCRGASQWIDQSSKRDSIGDTATDRRRTHPNSGSHGATHANSGSHGATHANRDPNADTDTNTANATTIARSGIPPGQWRQSDIPRPDGRVAR
jgi:hypothetical protein